MTSVVSNDVDDSYASNIVTKPIFSLSSSTTLQACANPPVFPGQTIFIASYPKSGTTWMQNIVFQLLSQGKHNCTHISQYAPFFEIDKNWQRNEDGEYVVRSDFTERHLQLGTRVFNTHLLWEMMPHGPPSQYKYIYVYRRAKDVCNSFYHHLRNQVEDNFGGTLKEFFSAWTQGDVPFGRWIDHIESWYRAKQDIANRSSIFMISYEDLIADLPSSVRSIADFLGVSLAETELERIIPLLTFDGMKANLTVFQPISVSWKEGYSFIRSGRIGEGTEVFDEEDSAMLMSSLQLSRFFLENTSFLVPLL